MRLSLLILQANGIGRDLIMQMHISSIKLSEFRRFHDLTINLPSQVRLVILTGPNGSGKSAVFDALTLWARIKSGFSWSGDADRYFARGLAPGEAYQRIHVSFHDFEADQSQDGSKFREIVYVRSAYRNEPTFSLQGISRPNHGGSLVEESAQRMTQTESRVSTNYQRLIGDALEGVFANEPASTTIGDFRTKTVGPLREAMMRLFPDLVLNDLGNPMQNATFRFDKGDVKSFPYQNLSSGEKAAFDLLLDLAVKATNRTQSVYCLDEPETHLNSRVQSALLEELLRFLPDQSQLWLATHSIGIMRRARDFEAATPGTVAFLDMSEKDFDLPQVLEPIKPGRPFWERALNVALNDMAFLVAPSAVVLCEGTPAGMHGKNTEFDARCLDTIFAGEFPDTRFVSVGNASDVENDRLALGRGISAIVKGCTIKRLVDKDDLSEGEIADLQKNGVRVLSRRTIENYLFDDDILTALCYKVGKQQESAELLLEKQRAVEHSVARGNPHDDLKSASGDIFNNTKRRLGLVGAGNSVQAFARDTLAPLVTSTTNVYSELRHSIFS